MTLNNFGGILIGLVVCASTGSLVKRIIKKAVENIDLVPPDGISQEHWAQVTAEDKISDAGKWLGILERILIFFSVWIEEYTIIVGWFAFKVASKWEVWSNIIKVPESLIEANDNLSTISYLKARRAWGARLLSRFLIGTLINFLIGFIVATLIKNL